ncbi:MAG: ATP-dependent helicase [Candidatus Kapabacteria bacterium]|nr:ATP-dependent helicase [Candidatus Kapabacteria bacterium]
MKKLVLTRATVPAATKGYRIDYAALLNPAQLEAVMHTDGPLLVLAGAGTGKTRTLTYRVARLVEDGHDPASILLLTFTRKAAAEMVRRASALLDGRCDKVAGGTFHSFAYNVLLRFGAAEGRRPWSILDQSDAEDVINLVRGRFNVAALKKRFPLKGTLHAMYSRAVNTATPIGDVIAERYPKFVDETERIAEVIRAYDAYKRANSLVDYDDLLVHLAASTRHPEIGPILRRQYRFVMVDEYQDTNVLQHDIIKGLIGERGNVMVVGDDAQSIYSFRGADVRNIHAVPQAFPGCSIVRLEQNYRSTQPILDVCNTILRDAPEMFRKELYTDREGGELPMRVRCTNERQQSDFVVQQILELREQGVPLGEIVVLIRSGFLSFDLEIELAKANIPFRKVGGLKFTEAAHVKDVLALLRLSVNPRDAIALYRSLLLLDGVGQKTAAAVLEQMQVLDNVPEKLQGVSGRAATSVSDLLTTLQRAREVSDAGERARYLAAWYRSILEARYDDSAKRWKDVETLQSICSRYSTTESFLADVALDPPTDVMDDIEADDGEQEFMTVSTIHSAKGLEWNTVFLIWANDGRIPSAKSAESAATLEEERRLLYVACTRAKERLVITYPEIMMEWEHADVLGRQSRFLDAVSDDACPSYTLAAPEDEPADGLLDA